MAIDNSLNTRQVEVLRWISEGCPEGRWAESGYKVSAASLQARRLIKVSKRGGWKATIEPAGLYYLQHGDYPRDHFPDKRRSFQRAMRLARSEAGEIQKPLTRPASDELTPTQKLLKDITAAGGVLQIDTKDDNTNYANLVAIINRRQLAPDGQQVISIRGERYGDLIFRFSAVQDWKTESPSALAEAARIKWHPAVVALRAEKRLDGITTTQRNRAWRLLQSLARDRCRTILLRQVSCCREGMGPSGPSIPAVQMAFRDEHRPAFAVRGHSRLQSLRSRRIPACPSRCKHCQSLASLRQQVAQERRSPPYRKRQQPPSGISLPVTYAGGQGIARRYCQAAASRSLDGPFLGKLAYIDQRKLNRVTD